MQARFSGLIRRQRQNLRMRSLECSEWHPRYPVSHDPHGRCPGLSVIARLIAAPWITERDHWRERERQIKRLSLAALARRCRTEFGRRFPRPRRWLAVDFLGGSGDYRTRRSPGNLRRGTPGEAEGCESQARLWRRYLRFTASIWATLHCLRQRLCLGLIPM